METDIDISDLPELAPCACGGVAQFGQVIGTGAMLIFCRLCGATSEEFDAEAVAEAAASWAEQDPDFVDPWCRVVTAGEVDTAGERVS